MPRLFLLFIALVALPAAADRLYERLGGERGVQAIADALVEQSRQDPATQRSFRKVNLKRLKQKLSEQLCQLSDGPCVYNGEPMREVHAGLQITEAEFFGMVDHLRKVLDQQQIAQADKNDLLARLAPLQRDIVGVPGVKP